MSDLAPSTVESSKSLLEAVQRLRELQQEGALNNMDPEYLQQLQIKKEQIEKLLLQLQHQSVNGGAAQQQQQQHLLQQQQQHHQERNVVEDDEEEQIYQNIPKSGALFLAQGK